MLSALLHALMHITLLFNPSPCEYYANHAPVPNASSYYPDGNTCNVIIDGAHYKLND